MSAPYAEVIGDPVSHSRSPAIHRFWLGKLGRGGDYRASHVLTHQLGEYVAGRRADSGWLGCNITLPHKIAILDHADRMSDIARQIGAANTLYRDDDSLVATNTDAGGFADPLAHRDWHGARAVIAGNGGAARAILHALVELGFERITVLARHPARAEALLGHAGLHGEIDRLDGAQPCADLLVNTTSLGMAGQPELPVHLGRMPPSAWIYDIVYTPLETSLLRAARARGLDTVDGLAMLIGQAARAFEHFFGTAAPREYDPELRALLTP